MEYPNRARNQRTHLAKVPTPIDGQIATLTELLEFRASDTPHRPAFRFLAEGGTLDGELTYAGLFERAAGVAAELVDRRLAGQRALLLYPAGLDFIVAFFGCLLARVVAVPAYPPRKNHHATRLDAIVGDAEASIVLTTRGTIGRLERIVACDSRLHSLPWVATDQLLPALLGDLGGGEAHGSTLAFLQYTSGSTGDPKGVMLTHANLMSNLAHIAQGFGTSASDVSVSWLPLYHDMGLIGGILQPLYAGIDTTLLAPATFLQRPFSWLKAVSERGATISGGPNFAYELCTSRISDEQLSQLDLSHWQIAFNGAEPVRESTLEAFARRFAPCGFRREAFYPCYGLAEATLMVTGGRRLGPLRSRSFSVNPQTTTDDAPVVGGTSRLVGCGSKFGDDDIRIVDPTTLQECAPGEVGEIWVAGPGVSTGYWNKPASSQETFAGSLDGSSLRYLRTGDLGLVDQGELFVTGRSKETIIVRGVNYYPADLEQEVEEACADLPHGGCAAFAFPTDNGEGLGIAVEAPRHGQLLAHQIADRACRHLTESHGIHPAAVFVVGPYALPRTSSGKLQRLACLRSLREGLMPLVDTWYRLEPQDESATSRASTPPPSDGGNIYQEMLEGVTRLLASQAKLPLDTIGPDTRLAELALDSLAWMDTLGALEDELGIRVRESALVESTTVADLAMAFVKAADGERQGAAEPRSIDRGDYDFAHAPEYLRLKETLRLTRQAGVDNPYFTVHEGTTGDRTTIAGREYLNFCSYNYLGMSGDPLVTRAAQQAVARYGTSVSASRLVSGEKPLHAELEQALADWVGVDGALALVGGHATNVTTIGHMFSPGDLVLHDSLAHNSIVQGCQLAGAERRAFRHNDVAACEQLLARYRSSYRRVLIAVEGIYSMDGDCCPLPEFIRLKEQYKAFLLVDEAHSLGTIGPGGRGIAAHFDLDPRRVDLWIGTLSKALGSCGGFVAASAEIIEYLRYTAPGFVYSVGMTPANAAAALESLRQLEQHPERVERLRENAQLFLDLARERGLDTGLSEGTPVVPVITESSVLALQLAERLFRQGINVQPILHPAVEEKGARLRFFITCQHTPEQIRHAVDSTARHWQALKDKQAAA
jgi:8-amino-7-oxononanoate synthase